jgi:signal transduction histidine kinase
MGSHVWPDVVEICSFAWSYYTFQWFYHSDTSGDAMHFIYFFWVCLSIAAFSYISRKQIRLSYSRIVGAHQAGLRAVRVSHAKRVEDTRQFGSFLFHEVRVPVNAAMIAVELLIDDDHIAQPTSKGKAAKTEPCYTKARLETGERTDVLHSLREQLERTVAILTDALDYGSIEGGQFHCEFKPYDLRKMLGSVERAVRWMAEERGLEFECIVDEKLTELCVIDQARLRQVRVCLCDVW